MSLTIDQRVHNAQTAVAAGFGDGWMSSSARDMIRIAGFAGFDVAQLKLRVAKSSNPNRSVNTATVERVMAELATEWDAAHTGSDGLMDLVGE